MAGVGSQKVFIMIFPRLYNGLEKHTPLSNKILNKGTLKIPRPEVIKVRKHNWKEIYVKHKGINFCLEFASHKVLQGFSKTYLHKFWIIRCNIGESQNQFKRPSSILFYNVEFIKLLKCFQNKLFLLCHIFCAEKYWAI